jgi:hypothetical protein
MQHRVREQLVGGFDVGRDERVVVGAAVPGVAVVQLEGVRFDTNQHGRTRTTAID